MTRWIRDFDNILRDGISKEQRIFARWYARRAKQYIDKTMKGIDQEAKETREMAVSFYRLLEHKLQLSDRTDPPTREEVKEAVEQLKDMGRYSVFVTAVIFPGGVISLLGLELLAKRYGIRFSFIPSAFRKKKKESPGDNDMHPPLELPGQPDGSKD